MGRDRMLSGLHIWRATFPLHPAPLRLPGTRAYEAAPLPLLARLGLPHSAFFLQRGPPPGPGRKCPTRVCRAGALEKQGHQESTRPGHVPHFTSPVLQSACAHATRANKTLVREGRKAAPAGAAEKFGSVPHPQKTEASRARDPEREQYRKGAKERDSLRRGTRAARASGAGRGRVGSPRGRAGRRTSRAAAAAAATSPPPSCGRRGS